MTSKQDWNEIFVWIWLPEATEPIVAGKLARIEDRVTFTYGQSYLSNPNAIPIYDEDLPLEEGPQEKKLGTDNIPNCIRDSAPDAWGRRVILNKIHGTKGKQADTGDLHEFTYLMKSSSDRIGALDFQESATNYVPRTTDQADLKETLDAAELVQQGAPLPEDLEKAIQHGTSIGGARPKALVTHNNKRYIAKFSVSTDIHNTIKLEYIATRLAKLCGLDVSDVELTKADDKDILLINRFDRVLSDNDWQRKLMLSALTLLGLDEMQARYASYEDFAEIIRYRFASPKATLHELFSRIVFNILCGNTDDHARNHSAFWDGDHLSLTPAYDLCPQLRVSGEATQAMLITSSDNSSRLVTCLVAARNFMLSEQEARTIIDDQISTIRENWDSVCDEANLSTIDKSIFWNQAFLMDYAFDNYSQ